MVRQRGIGTCLLLVGGLLGMAGCSHPSETRACYVTPGRERADAGSIVGSMTVWSQRRWCGYVLVRDSAVNYSEGRIASAPAHGDARVVRGPQGVGLYYRPQAGYVGRDSFSGTFLPDSVTVRLEVDVIPVPAGTGPAP